MVIFSQEKFNSLSLSLSTQERDYCKMDYFCVEEIYTIYVVSLKQRKIPRACGKNLKTLVL